MTTDPTPSRSVFDDLTVGPASAGSTTIGRPATAEEPPVGQYLSGQPAPDPGTGPPGIATSARSTGPAGAAPSATPAQVKQATQELLRLGVLYAEAKPNLFQAVLANRALVAAILEPLDLALRIDEVRAMVILTVAPSLRGSQGDGGLGSAAGARGAGSVDDDVITDGAGSRDGRGDDEWTHPLVRRQRLTLAQSLLLAILRRRYVEHEKTADGTLAARVSIDDLGPELQTYLGDEGSDSANESRLRRLLEQLREHGIVSAVDDDEQITIRPLICHLADPTSLQLLLHHYTRLAGGDAASGPDAVNHNGGDSLKGDDEGDGGLTP